MKKIVVLGLIVLVSLLAVLAEARVFQISRSCQLSTGSRNTFLSSCPCSLPDVPVASMCDPGQTCCGGVCCNENQFCDLGLRNAQGAVGFCRDLVEGAQQSARRSYQSLYRSSVGPGPVYGDRYSRSSLVVRNREAAIDQENSIARTFASRDTREVSQKVATIQLTSTQAEENCTNYFVERCKYYSGEIVLNGATCVCEGFQPFTGRPVRLQSFARR